MFPGSFRCENMDLLKMQNMIMTRKILVTGFEPFGEQAKNASWEVIKQIPLCIGNCEITRLQVPVVFGKAGEYVIRHAEAWMPDMKAKKLMFSWNKTARNPI